MASIDETIKLGNDIISNGLTESRFNIYKSKVRSAALSHRDNAISKKKSVLPVIENLIMKNEEDYKMNIFFQVFYFKKYQYKYVVNPWANKSEHIKLRFIIETNEILVNLKDS